MAALVPSPRPNPSSGKVNNPGWSTKEVEFYKTAQEVSDAARRSENSWEQLAVRYLEQGTTVVVSPHWVDDLLTGQARICQFFTLTDGSWIWPSSLAYYLKTYHVALPDEFLMHMASPNWTAPKLDDAALDAVCDRLEFRYGTMQDE